MRVSARGADYWGKRGSQLPRHPLRQRGAPAPGTPGGGRTMSLGYKTTVPAHRAMARFAFGKAGSLEQALPVLTTGAGRTIGLWIQNEPCPRIARWHGFASGKAGRDARSLHREGRAGLEKRPFTASQITHKWRETRQTVGAGLCARPRSCCAPNCRNRACPVRAAPPPNAGAAIRFAPGGRRKKAPGLSSGRWASARYLAKSIARVSRMTLTLIWPGYSISRSMRLTISLARMRVPASLTSSGLTMMRTSRPDWMA